MTDWKDRLVDDLRAGPSPRPAATSAQGERATLRARFDEARQRLAEAVAYVADRAGLVVTPVDEEGGTRVRWQHLSRSLLVRLEPDGSRFVISVTTERDYVHAEVWLEGGRLLSVHEDRIAAADLDALVQVFVRRLFVEREETP
jgi:hypothetical protein